MITWLLRGPLRLPATAQSDDAVDNHTFEPCGGFCRRLIGSLRQRDLPEVGAQSVVSAVLAGKRAPNLRQTAALARRFGVPVDTLK